MNWKEEYKPLLWIIGFFVAAYLMPLQQPDFQMAILSALELLKWYAREHVLLCLIPAFFIAGVISVFINQAAVIKYFGAQAKKWVSYAIASVSGSILAVCSCTILPLFSGIYKRGAGLGPAIAFLYSGPAINILAIILTARILGLELGIARVIGAVSFSVIIGLCMHLIYHKEEQEKATAQLALPPQSEGHPLWQTSFHFLVLVAILIFATWGNPQQKSGFWNLVFTYKWWLVAFFSLLLAWSLIAILRIKLLRVVLSAIPIIILVLIFPDNPVIVFTGGVIMLSILLSVTAGEPQEWMSASWGFAKQILPLLAAGVLAAGFFLGSPEGGSGIIPNRWISALVGGNSPWANFFASVVGAFMYFATLTEVPILQGLIASGMGKGPALALLLAGPALSLPSMLVIRNVI
ncbi:MAG: permease, partial [Caldithrix sp. RBG_13_44_9]